MINHKHKFIFVHIPKTAGIALRRALGGDEISQHFKYWRRPRKWRGYFKFTFVRNPWDRAVSAYHFLYSGGISPYDDNASSEVQKYKTFQNFICSDFFKNPNKLLHFESMHHYTHKPPGRRNVAFIGKFENLQEDFDIVCDKIGIPRQKLPHKNKTKHKHYPEYYDDETREIVAEKYAKDIEYFGYEFGE